jgi:hypothetical protein
VRDISGAPIRFTGSSRTAVWVSTTLTALVKAHASWAFQCRADRHVQPDPATGEHLDRCAGHSRTRLTLDDGKTAMQIHWDEAADTFSLVARLASFAPGSPQPIETESAFLDLASASMVGSGPTGQCVTSS